MSTQMNGFKFIKFLLISSVLGIGLFTARSASALACVNDDDCPEAACGGQVCDWPHLGLMCAPAGSYPKGEDGWCTDDSDCKCRAAGATCILATQHCTFTKPSDAPGGGATGGASGSTGGASAGTGGASAGTGGASAGTGGTSSGTDGGTKPASGDSGGCSVAGAPSSTWVGALAGLAALIISRRRRSRS